MSTAADLVASFERLSIAEQQEVFQAIIELISRGEFEPLTDESLAQIADLTLVELDRAERR